jgi:hypothetical protein
MIKQLTKLANHLDSKGLSKEADYLDDIIRKMAFFGKVKLSQSQCTGFGGINHKITYTTIDRSAWDKKLFEKTKALFGAEASQITKKNISYEVVNMICKDVHNHMNDNHWALLPPHIEGTQNRPSVLGFKIESGKVAYSPEIVVAQGYNNANTGFDWSAFNASTFVTAIQAHVNHLNFLLNEPKFKLELYITHG